MTLRTANRDVLIAVAIGFGGFLIATLSVGSSLSGPSLTGSIGFLILLGAWEASPFVALAFGSLAASRAAVLVAFLTMAAVTWLANVSIAESSSSTAAIGYFVLPFILAVFVAAVIGLDRLGAALWGYGKRRNAAG